jgi:hypothetical protein
MAIRSIHFGLSILMPKVVVVWRFLHIMVFFQLGTKANPDDISHKTESFKANPITKPTVTKHCSHTRQPFSEHSSCFKCMMAHELYIKPKPRRFTRHTDHHRTPSSHHPPPSLPQNDQTSLTNQQNVLLYPAAQGLQEMPWPNRVRAGRSPALWQASEEVPWNEEERIRDSLRRS